MDDICLGSGFSSVKRIGKSSAGWVGWGPVGRGAGQEAAWEESRRGAGRRGVGVVELLPSPHTVILC